MDQLQSLEFVVIRDGEVVYRSAARTAVRIPERGSVMATEAVTAGASQFYNAVQHQHRVEAAKNAAAGMKGRVLGAVHNVIWKIKGSRLVAWAVGAVRSGWGLFSRTLTRLGTTGTGALVLGMYASKPVQVGMALVVRKTWNLLDLVAQGLTKVISWIPFVGAPTAKAATKSRQWTNRKVLNAVLWLGKTRIVRAFRYDGIVARSVRNVAFPYAVLRIIATLIPGGAIVHGLCYLAWTLWVANKVLNTNAASLAAFGLGTVFSKEAREARNAFKQSAAQVTEAAPAAEVTISEPGPQVVGQLRPEEEEEKIPQNVLDKMFARHEHAYAISTATKVFYLKDEPAGSLQDTINALVTLLHPEFKATDLTNTQAKKAAVAYSTAVAKLAADGDLDFEDPQQGECPRVLTVLATEAMAAVFDPMKKYNAAA